MMMMMAPTTMIGGGRAEGRAGGGTIARDALLQFDNLLLRCHRDRGQVPQFTRDGPNRPARPLLLAWCRQTDATHRHIQTGHLSGIGRGGGEMMMMMTTAAVATCAIPPSGHVHCLADVEPGWQEDP